MRREGVMMTTISIDSDNKTKLAKIANQLGVKDSGGRYSMNDVISELIEEWIRER